MTKNSAENTNLEKDLGALFNQDPEKDTVLILMQDPEQSGDIKSLVREAMPNLKTVEATSIQDAAERVTGQTRKHIAMIVTIEGEGVKAPAISALLGTENNVPTVLIANKNVVGTRSIRDVEAITRAPLDLTEFESTLAESINKRRGLFAEMEQEARSEVLEKLAPHYLLRAETWAETVELLGAEGSSSNDEELQLLKDVAINFVELLKNLQTKIATVTDSELTKIVPELMNSLSSLIIVPGLIIDDGQLSETQAQALRLIKNQATQMNEDLQLVGQAYQNQRSWQKIKAAISTPS